MFTILAGVFFVFLFVLATAEPLAAGAIGVLAALGYLRLDGLEQRIRRMEAVAPGTPAAQLQDLFAEAARARTPIPAPEPRSPAPAPASGTFAPARAAMPTPQREPEPAAAPAEPSAIERWSTASWGELEDLFAGRLLAVVGGIALFLGGVFFLGLAFSRGWIGPELRVAMGLVVGLALFALGGWLLRGPRLIVAHVLVAVGLGVFSLALFAATRLHGFIAPEFGVAAALLVAAAAAMVAIWYSAPLVAAFGLIAVLASPPVMGASASLVTMAFIGAALAGTTAIALYRSWSWLPMLAFLLAAPQLAAYLAGDPELGIALGALAGFWLLNAISAGGEEFRVRRYRLSATSATVLVANAAFGVAAGFAVLDGDLERWRGLFLIVVALAHMALAAVFLLRESDRHPFGMLAAGTGIAAVTMAVPIQLGAMWVPLAWAAEAVALIWIAVERRHRYSAAVAGILGTLAAGHIVSFEYLIDWSAEPAFRAVPFVNPSGMALAFVVGAAAVAGWLLRKRREWVAVAAVAAVLVVIAVPHELRGWGEAMALTTLAAGLVCVQRAVLGIPLRAPSTLPASAVVERALYGAAVVAGAFTAHAFFHALTVGNVVNDLSLSAIASSRPFLNQPTTVAVIVAGGALSVAVVCSGRWTSAGLLTAVAAIAWLLPTQVGGAVAVAGWAALAIGLMAAAGRIGPALAWGARGLAALAITETLVILAPVGNLVVSRVASTQLPVLNGSILAVVAITAMLAARAMLPPHESERRWAAVAAGVLGVYGVSIGLVDLFQAQVGGPIALEELQKQAQVALSVLWAIIGSVATIVGLRLGRASLRLSGLALLGIVTLKVFVVDLAALDIAYRVLSLVALGVLLLVAAYLYGRLQPTKRQAA